MLRPFILALLLAAPAAAQTPPQAYREDTPHVSGDLGQLVFAVRSDAGGALCGTDGDRCVLQVDASGNLRVAGSTTVVGTVAVTQSGSWTVTANQGGAWSVSLAAGANTIGKVDQGAPGASAWLVDGSGVVQPVSVASLPLPSGAATSAKQDTGNTSLASVDLKLVLPAALDTGALKVREQGTITVGGSITADTELPAAAALSDTFANPTAPAVGAFTMYWDGAQWVRWNRSVTVASLPLPSGAATSANQATEIASLASIDGKLTNPLPVSAATLPLPTGAATLAEQQTQTTSLGLLDDSVSTVGAAVPTKGIQVTGTDGTNARVLKTDASGEPQVDVLTLPAITGTVTANAGTNLNTSLLALDTSVDGLEGGVGAAADAAATAGSTGSITAKLRFVTTALDDIRTSSQLIDDAVSTTGSAVPAKGIQFTGTDGTNARAIKTDANGEPQVDVLTMPTVTVTPSYSASSNSDGSCVSVAATTTVLSSFATRHAAVIMAQCDPSACNTDTVFLKFAATATTGNYPLAPGDKVTLGGPNVYSGVIDAIANSGTQKVCVLEW